VEELGNYIFSFISDFIKFPIYVEDKVKQIFDDNVISHTNLMKKVRKILNSPPSKIAISYWTCRGYSESEAISIISKLQKSRSPLCIEYWTNKGYTIDQACDKIHNIQTKRGNRFKEVHKGDYESFSNRCISFWTNKGYTEDEARKIIQKRQKYISSKDYQIEKHVSEVGNYKWDLISKSKSHHGSNNGQFGKPSPSGSGRGYSGYYKENYFRSLLELYFLFDCDKNGIKYICNEYSDSKIVLKMDNGKNYYPDFIVGDHIVEVKSKWRLTHKDTLYKMNQTIKHYPNYKYRIISEIDIPFDKNMLVDEYNRGNIKIDISKRQKFIEHMEKL